MSATFTQVAAKGREAIRDPLYRGSLILLANTAVLSLLGFAFWALAARKYPQTTVGAFTGLSSGIGLFSAVASLGLQNMVTRHLASSESPRGLLLVVTVSITALGGALCAVVLLGLGPFLPDSLHSQAHGGTAFLFTALVILTSLNSAWSAGLVALRSPEAVFWTNLVGAIAKLAGLFLLVSLRSSGLILAFSIGLIISTLAAVPSLAAKAGPSGKPGGTLVIFRGYFALTVNNYVATILGITPTTLTPLVIIAERGPSQAAPFALAFMLTGFLNVIPSTMSQVLFAEISRCDVDAGKQLRKAIRAIYALLIPAVLMMVAAAPILMRVFGASYAAAGASVLRILVVTTLATSGGYLVDSMLIARDRSVAYLFMNGVNAALVLGCVGLLVRRGIVAGAEGWALAQFISLLLGLMVMAVSARGGKGRHCAKRSSAAADPPQYGFEKRSGLPGLPASASRPGIPPTCRICLFCRY